jgi:hypothetical protein
MKKIEAIEGADVCSFSICIQKAGLGIPGTESTDTKRNLV